MNKRKFSQQIYDQYVEQGSCCYYCKKQFPFSDITRDHFLPVSEGNTLVNNKVFACRKCNSLKGDKSVDEFRKFLVDKICQILRDVVQNDWKISKRQVEYMKWYSQLLKTTGEIIDNGYKPLVIFT